MGEKVAGTETDKSRKRRLPEVLYLIAAASFAVSSPHAQQETGQTAQAAAARNFDIPAAPLADALTIFGIQSSQQVSVDADVVRGLSSPAVKGVMTPDQALNQLLAASGLTYRIVGNTVTLQKLPQMSQTDPRVVQLGPVNVQGMGDSPYGAGNGYVAPRTVTGSKSDTPLIEIPQSISVVTRQQMDDQAVQNTGQVLRYTSGVFSEIQPVTGIFDNFMFVRGFTPDQYLDGLKLPAGNWGVSQVDPYLLSRVEVLHGPGSILYGQGTPGGTVMLTSKLPTERARGEVLLQGGSYGHKQAAFDVSGPLDDDGRYLYRFVGLGLGNGSQVDYGSNARFALAPSFTWKPDASTTLTLLGQFQKDTGPVFYGFVPASGTVLFNPNGQIPTNRLIGDPSYSDYNRTVAQVGYRFEHQFDSNWTFRQNFRYQNLAVNTKNLFEAGLDVDSATLFRYAFNDIETMNNIAVDNQVLANLTTGPLRHSVVLGIDYQWNTSRAVGAFNFNVPSINLFNPVYNMQIEPLDPAFGFALDTKQSQNQLGLYLQDQIRIGRWSFMLGIRKDWANASTTDFSGGTAATSTQFDQAVTYRAGVTYLFDNGIAPYASYSTSFAPTPGTTAAGTPFVPTTGEQFEIGVKYQPPGFNSFLTASAFNLTQKNVLTPDPQNPIFSIQTGEVRVRGFEFEAHASLNDNLDLVAAFTYLDALNTQSTLTDVTVNGTTDMVQGKPVVSVPSVMASFWSTYTFDSGAARGLGLGGGVRYVGPSPGDDVNSFAVPGFTLFDAMVRYDLGRVSPRLERVSLQLNAANLFDTQYVASCTNVSFCSYGLRRTVYATLKYKW